MPLVITADVEEEAPAVPLAETHGGGNKSFHVLTRINPHISVGSILLSYTTQHNMSGMI